jgi:hypothetical protein
VATRPYNSLIRGKHSRNDHLGGSDPTSSTVKQSTIKRECELLDSTLDKSTKALIHSTARRITIEKTRTCASERDHIYIYSQRERERVKEETDDGR